MATSKENNWGGMSPSSAKLTTPKSVASTLKSKTAASTAKTKTSAPKPAPVQLGRDGKPFGSNAVGLGTILNDYFGGVQQRLAAGTADTGKLPTPATANISKPAVQGVPLYLQKPAATPKPSVVVAGKAGTGSAGAQAKSIYDYLNVDPTAIYQPLVDLVGEQRRAANERYQANLGDIKNIFSSLTSVAPADRLRINEQFKNMLTAQQTALAARTAAATQQGEAGAAQAVATGAERGGGPAMALNPLQTATAEGIGQSNAISSIWEGLQGANQAQALADVENRGAGYTSQQLAATQGLQQSLQDRLAGIAGTEADIQSQLAQQKFGIAQDIGQAKYTNALAAQQAAAQAAAAAAAASAKAASKIPAVDKIRNSLGSQRFNALANQLNSAYGRAYAGSNPLGATRTSEPSVAAVMAEWVNVGGNRDLINEARTLAENLYSK